MAPPPVPKPILSVLLLLLLFLSFHPPAKAQKQLTSFSIADSPWFPSDNRILVSPNRTFAAGFRSSSDGFFFAVWVQKSSDKTVVWSLNRLTPVGSSSGLAISPAGVLSLNDSSGRNLWPNPPVGGSSNGSSQLVLQESGKLDFGKWTSFDSPTDTVLTNQSLPQQNITLSSGSYQLINATSLVFNVSDEYWTADAAIRNLSSDGKLLMDDANTYILEDMGLQVLRRLTLDTDGNLRVYSLERSGQWRVVWQATQDLCIIHGTCGVNAICQPHGSTLTNCSCPPGYKFARNIRDCQRKIQSLQPSKFVRLDYVSFSDQPGMDKPTSTQVNFEICKSRCLSNSSCVAFSYKYTGTQDCVHLSQLINGFWSPSTELATFLRVSSSERDESQFTAMTSMIATVCPVRVSLPAPPKEAKTTARNVAIIATLFTLELLAGILSFWAFLRKYSKYRDMARTFGFEFLPGGGPKRFSYAELKAATKDFSNVIGSGGYGVVYKGQLPDRRVIAVKRLKNVGGGEAEFWAEVTIIARMHHLNLVRMWGFCAEKEQRMLVYEYIPNGSLDKFLFPNEEVALGEDTTDESKKHLTLPRPLLDWNIRYRIALGVARAIAYLHEECLEWVLHCDIKPENILLEDDFCPKVSDFGLSKLTNKKDKVTMSRIRGTRGYLAPEWVIHREPITAKADVYSFGMVLLEIVTGVRNSGFRRSSLQSEDWYFPKWAFEKVYVEQKVEDILDSRIADTYDDQAHFELVERMVKTAMWCLQDRAEMRPSMGKVAKMLEGTVEITEPAKPTIFCVREE